MVKVVSESVTKKYVACILKIFAGNQISYDRCFFACILISVDLESATKKFGSRFPKQRIIYSNSICF